MTYKIQIEIDGVSTIALIDKREPYSFMTTPFARALNFKPKRCNSTGPIIGRVPCFSFSVNNKEMSFSMDVLSNEEIPILMLGKDWLKMVKHNIFLHQKY